MSYQADAHRYDSVRCRRCGLELLLISLGPWQNFGADRPIDAARAIQRRAFALGITRFGPANGPCPTAPTSRLPGWRPSTCRKESHAF